MGMKEENFFKKLRRMFKVEADEHLRAISSGLLELKKEPDSQKQTAIIETVFRETHSLKGAARAVDLTDIERICQAAETVFSALKRKNIGLSPELFDTLYKAIDTIADLGASTDGKGTVPGKDVVSGLRLRLVRLATGEHDDGIKPENQDAVMPESEIHDAIPSEPRFADKKPALPETVRISTAKLDALLLQAEEMISLKLTAAQHADDIQDAKAILGQWRKEWRKVYPATIKEQHDDVQLRSQWTKIKTVFDRNQDHMQSLEGKLADLTALIEDGRRSIGGMVDNLNQDIKEVLMLPFSFMLEIFPRFVRELSHDQGKDVELTLRGGDTKIDRRILEEMKDPLVHLVRNCIDHGIEKPKEREHHGKPRRGTITMAISNINGHQVEILISDDGRGIDPVQVKEAAVARGVLSRDEADKLHKQEILSLIFRSDVSTNPMITDISGRGLGLAIVQDNVEKLGGRISLETGLHTGTWFKIVLPLTLAAFRGILVRTADQLLMIPTSNVQQVVRIKRDEIKTVENRKTIQLNGYAVPLVRLDTILELPPNRNHRKAPEFISALVLGSSEKPIAFRVDGVLNEQEALLKNLGNQLSRVRNVAGATVLGSGGVVPVLNASDLMKSAVKESAALPKTIVKKGAFAEKEKKALVVEDSITSRMLLKNILESAGYQVKTAVDGIDAYTTLRTETFDLVVSDVDMPRMNGFGLTTKIRSDKKLAELPVVLVTALESGEDRERGMDVGADAYIVKSSFDQSNLLEVIQRLV